MPPRRPLLSLVGFTLRHRLQEAVKAVLPSHMDSLARIEEVRGMPKWFPRIGLAVFIVAVVAAAIFLVRDFSFKDRAYVERAAKATQEYRDHTDRQIARCYRPPAGGTACGSAW